MSAINIDQNNIQSEVMNSDKPVLLDFWAPWCGPCRMVVPIVEEIARERNDIKVGKVNVDEQPELASRFGVVSIPTYDGYKEFLTELRKIGTNVNQIARACNSGEISNPNLVVFQRELKNIWQSLKSKPPKEI